MCYRIIIYFFVILMVPNWIFAQNVADKNATVSTPQTELKQESKQKDETKQGCQTSDLIVVGKNEGKELKDFLLKMGESLNIRASGECVTRIKKELNDPTSKGVTLYLNGVPMVNLLSSLIQTQNGKEIFFSFDLFREANNDDNRKAWDMLFKKTKGYLMTIQPALALVSDLPMVVQSSKPLKFYVASGGAIWLTLIIGLTILLVSFYLLVNQTEMLRDKDTRYYSLGKSQMAFWGLLVLLAFTAVWILTGTMERIPPQTLTLLGISSATGLSAVLIGNSKKSEIKNEITKLRKEEQDIREKDAQTPPPLATANKNLLARITEIIDTLEKQLKPGESKGFWRDICDDGNGLSFHRLQVVIWTMILGAVFVRSVAHGMSMPEFSETLLVLLGISNATYLGFKIPEKP